MDDGTRYDFNAIHYGAFTAAGLNESHRLVANASDVQEGDLFVGGLTGYQIYHAAWKPLPDHAWVEVTHAVVPTEENGAWVFRQRGSGIWYNLGRTKVFEKDPADPRKVHMDAAAFMTANCSWSANLTRWPEFESVVFGRCAREKGYDSIQFGPSEGESPRSPATQHNEA